MLHEIPREICDSVILLQNNFSDKMTIMSNGIVNLVSIFGAYLGLNSINLSPEQYLYFSIFVAANFIYVTSGIWKDIFHSSNIYIYTIEILGVIAGFMLIVLSEMTFD